MSYKKKERFLSWTALQNKDQVFRICCKTCNISKENWMFVMNMCIYNEYTCGICNEQYHNSCIDFEPSLTHSVPLFIYNYCIDPRFYQFILFLSLMLCDIFDMKHVSIKQSFTESLAISDAIKLRLYYHEFLPLYQQNQNKKLIGKMKILSVKVISSQYLKCYISAVLQL